MTAAKSPLGIWWRSKARARWSVACVSADRVMRRL
jgi:hypothetical protein